MSRVLIVVRGGIVNVIVEDESTQVLVVAYDTDGSLGSVEDPGGNRCCVASHAENLDPAAVGQYFDHFKH